MANGLAATTCQISHCRDSGMLPEPERAMNYEPQ
jgi:hypothetical protein